MNIQNVDEPSKLTSLEINDLLSCLPHRYPFLMLDKIVDIDGDERATGIKNVSFNEPIFQGHFPGNPVFPGVLIIEGMAQTAGAIVIAAERERGMNHLVYMRTIDKAKFRKPAVPGDRLEYHIRKIRRRKNIGRFYARAMVGDQLIAEAEVGAMIVEK